jgi:hypothetical protein
MRLAEANLDETSDPAPGNGCAGVITTIISVSVSLANDMIAATQVSTNSCFGTVVDTDKIEAPISAFPLPISATTFKISPVSTASPNIWDVSSDIGSDAYTQVVTACTINGCNPADSGTSQGFTIQFPANCCAFSEFRDGVVRRSGAMRRTATGGSRSVWLRSHLNCSCICRCRFQALQGPSGRIG